MLLLRSAGDSAANVLIVAAANVLIAAAAAVPHVFIAPDCTDAAENVLITDVALVLIVAIANILIAAAAHVLITAAIALFFTAVDSVVNI